MAIRNSEITPSNEPLRLKSKDGRLFGVLSGITLLTQRMSVHSMEAGERERDLVQVKVKFDTRVAVRIHTNELNQKTKTIRWLRVM